MRKLQKAILGMFIPFLFITFLNSYSAVGQCSSHFLKKYAGMRIDGAYIDSINFESNNLVIKNYYCGCTHFKEFKNDHELSEFMEDFATKLPIEKSLLKNKLLNCNICPVDKLLYVFDMSCGVWYKVEKNADVTYLGSFPNEISKKKEFRIVIININRYVYDAFIKAEDIDNSSTTPAIFSTIFLNGGLDLNKIFEEQKFKPSNYNGEYTTHSSPDNFLLWRFEVLRDKFRDQLNSTNQLWHSIIDEQFKMLDLDCVSDKQSNDAQRDYYKPRIIKQEFITLKYDYKNLLTFIDSVKELKKTFPSNNVNEDQKIELDKIKLILQDEGFYKELWAKISIPEDDEINKTAFFVNNQIKENYFFKSEIIVPKGDRLKLSLSIRGNDSSIPKKWNSYPLKNINSEFNIPIVKKFVFNFSTGPFVAIGSSFYQNEYSFRKVNIGGILSDTMLTLEKTSTSVTPFGVSALANYVFKFCKGFGFGPSIGAAVTVEKKPRLAYVGGLSFLMGDKHQFIVSTGFCAMQSRVLNSTLYPVGVYYKNAEEVEYLQKWNAGGFISLTYSIFTPQARSENNFSGKAAPKEQ